MPDVVATSAVHWMTVPVPGKSLVELAHLVGPLHRAAGGGMGHPERYVHESGAKVYAGSDRASQPIVVDVPGDVCEGWGQTWVEWFHDLGGYVTRLDVALDLEPAELARKRLLQLRRDFNAGRVETRIRRDSMTWYQGKGEGEGCTLYLGGRTAEHRIRCYDRRGPLRIEHQWRPSSREMGEQLPEKLLKYGSGSIWRSLSNRLRFTQLSWYMDLLNGQCVDLLFKPRASTSFPDAVAQLRHQMGLSLCCMRLCGVTLDDLTRDVSLEQLTGDQLAKFHDWSLSADAHGLNGQPLRDALQRSKVGTP